MKIIFSSCALVLLLFNSQAQEILKFGKLTDDLLNYDHNKLDSSADAVKLFDIGETTLTYVQNAGWKVTFDRHVAIKIISNQGYQWANHEVALYHEGGEKESIGQLKGFTYNLENGSYTKYKLEKSSIYEEETNDFWDKVKLTMPNVKEGSIVEYQYQITSPFYFNLPSWSFQSSIPVVYSEYVTRIPEYFSYKTITQGYHSFSRNESETNTKGITLQNFTREGTTVVNSKANVQTINYREDLKRIAAENLPAMNDETFVSSLNNYVLKIEYELQSTNFPGSGFKDYRNSWESLNSSFLANLQFGKQLDNTGYIKSDLENLKIKYPNKEEQLTATYEFIRDNMSWNGFRSKYVNLTLRDAFRDHSGNSADINIMLTAALRELGFKASPVLISTRGNGMVRPNFPTSGQFDYVICLVVLDDKEILLDATDKVFPIGYLPPRCFNDKGWVVNENGGFWVNLVPLNGHDENYEINLVLDDEVFKGKIHSKKVGYASFNSRNKLTKDGESGLLESYNNRYSGWTIDNYKAVPQPAEFIEDLELEISDAIEKVGNLYLITPIILGAINTNPFKLDKRDYPIDFNFPQSVRYTSTIEIPEGYQIDEIPKPVNIMLPEKGGRFLFNVSVLGNKITITNLLSINQQVYPAAMYPYLKEFYKMIVDKHAEKIVLKSAS